MDNPGHNLLDGTYHHGSQTYVSANYETFDLADRIGSGDAFMAGLIYGLYHELNRQEIVDFATSAAFQKLFVTGDFSRHTADHIRENIASARNL